jgi:hypothetical protein
MTYFATSKPAQSAHPRKADANRIDESVPKHRNPEIASA